MSDPTGKRRSRRDWAFDTGAFLLAIAIGLLTFDEVQRSGEASELLLGADLLAGCAACLALWGRRRWPLGLALLIAPIAAFSAMASGAAAVALFGLAVRRPLRTVLPVTALYLLQVPLYTLIRPEDGVPQFEAIGFGTVITLGLVGWGTYVRTRLALVQSLGERADRAEAEQRAQVEAVRRNERARIAREMHDVLGHRLSLLSLHAGALEYGGSGGAPSTASAAVIRENAHAAMEDLRTVVGLLRDEDDLNGAGEPDAPQPTLADLPRLLEECRDSGMHLTYEGPEDLVEVPEGIGRQAYRIVQEGLTNARKHAPGCAVTVRVGGERGAGLEVDVVNRLPVGSAAPAPPPVDPAPGTGLLGVAERSELAGGREEHGLTPDGDFRLRVHLPWLS